MPSAEKIIDPNIEIDEKGLISVATSKKTETKNDDSDVYVYCCRKYHDTRRKLSESEPDHADFTGKYERSLDGEANCCSFVTFSWMNEYVDIVKHGLGFRQYDLHQIDSELRCQNLANKYYETSKQYDAEYAAKAEGRMMKFAKKVSGEKNLTKERAQQIVNDYFKKELMSIKNLSPKKQVQKGMKLKKLQNSLRTDGDRNNALKLVLRMCKKNISTISLCSFFYAFFVVGASIVSQYLMQWATDVTTKRNKDDEIDELTKSYGIMYSIGVLLMKICQTFIDATISANAFKCAMRSCACILSIVYEKLLNVNEVTKSQANLGGITNIIIGDSLNMAYAFQTFQMVVMAPVSVIFAIIYARIICGTPYFWVGFAVLILLLPISICVLGSNMYTLTKILNVRDKRLKMTGEILRGINVIKYFGSEELQLKRVEHQRSKEITYGRYLVFKFNVIMGIFHVSASLMTLVFCIPLALTKNDILFDMSLFMTCYMLISTISSMVLMLPMGISGYIMASASSRRVSAFLNLPEPDSYIRYDLEKKFITPDNNDHKKVEGDKNSNEDETVEPNKKLPLIEVTGCPSFNYGLSADRLISPALDPMARENGMKKKYIMLNNSTIFAREKALRAQYRSFMIENLSQIDHSINEDSDDRAIATAINVLIPENIKNKAHPNNEARNVLVALILGTTMPFNHESEDVFQIQTYRAVEKFCYDFNIYNINQIDDFTKYEHTKLQWHKKKYDQLTKGTKVVVSTFEDSLRAKGLTLKSSNSLKSQKFAIILEELKMQHIHSRIIIKLGPKLNPSPDALGDLPDAIKHLELKAYEDEIIGVIGKVSSGKTSLLNALMGQLRVSNTDNGRQRILQGENPISVIYRDAVTYYSSNFAIFTGTVRDNIVFHEPWDEERYNKVLDLCCLRPDLEIMDSYDLSPVGESAGTLSGGQKARVMLARCAYSKAKIVLLDDCLSAVDSHTGAKIWHGLITGFMREEHRTVIICTHQTHYFISQNPVDKVALITDGKVEISENVEEVVTGNLALMKKEKNPGVSATSSASSGVSGDSSASGASGEEDNKEGGKNILDALLPKTGVNMSQRGPSHSHTHEQKIIVEEDKEKESKRILVGDGALTAEEIEVRRHTLASLYTEEKKTGRGGVQCKSYCYFIKEGRVVGFLIYFILMLLMVCLDQVVSLTLQEWSITNIMMKGMIDDPKIDFESYTPKSVITGLPPIVNHTFKNLDEVNIRYLWTFAVIAIALFLISVLNGATLCLVWFKASNNVFKHMMKGLMRAPLRYYDTTPIGRIVNRVSRDVESVEIKSIQQINWILFIVQLLATLIMMGISAYFSLIIIVPCICVFIVLLVIFRSACPEFKRVEAVTKSPVISQISETAMGIAVIKATKKVDVFRKEYYNRVEVNTAAFYPYICAQKWISFRSNITAAFIAFAASLGVAIGIAYVKDAAFVGAIGSALSSAQLVSFVASNFIVSFSTFESEFASIDRCLEYANLESEASWTKPRGYDPKKAKKHSKAQNGDLEDGTHEEEKFDKDGNSYAVLKNPNWASQPGVLELKDLHFRYRPELPLVLKGISYTIQPKERVGLVGRTGSSKSTTINALFRINECEEGSHVYFNGVDLFNDVGLHPARQALSIVPQIPFLQEGTLRENIDPFYLAINEGVKGIVGKPLTDDRIWEILEMCKLKSFVESQPGGIDMMIAEDGGNLSTGIRQLICVAKIIPLDRQIVILDEATASLDKASDRAVQEAIKTALKEKTIISIAHRLDTVGDYDKICVMEMGRVAEFDTPANLLRNPNSLYYGLCKKTGEKSFKKLYNMAFEAESKKALASIKNKNDDIETISSIETPIINVENNTEDKIMESEEIAIEKEEVKEPEPIKEVPLEEKETIATTDIDGIINNNNQEDKVANEI